MKYKQPIRIKTITEFHRLTNLTEPEHPLISLIDYSNIQHSADDEPVSVVFDFYSISLKKGLNFKMIYGQHEYDFDEGVMFFMAPGQLLRVEVEPGRVSDHSGWLLLIHPDFIWNTSLAASLKNYHFFDYATNESLFLSLKEESVLNGIVHNINEECHANIDHFSHQIIIAQVEVLLSYAERFYRRQFLTRRKTNHQILERLEKILAEYFDGGESHKKGSLSVKGVAKELNLSPDYLSEVLKTLTGQNTQQHIHDKLIEKAKEKLSTTNLTVSEIAYELGFEHLQSFSKLFKTKTKLSPVEFRASFN